ncbi:MAG: hypothetical protein AAF639_05790 [Chloroflexota bacterium]
MTTNIQTSTMESSNQSDQPNQSWLPAKGTILFTLCAMLMTVGLTLGTGFYALSTGIINVGAASLNQPAANAPSTSIIPYQGRLADADGNPLTATVDMHFRLYNTAEGGTLLWEETWTDANGVQATDGLFNVMLGSMIPISATVMSENSSLFLGLAAGDDDEMTPRVQLGSVPFAMQGWRVPDGSITRKKLADEIIEHHTVTTPESFWVIPTCGRDGNDDSIWTTIPGLSIDLTLDKPKTVWLDFSGLGMNMGSHKDVYSNIFIDGVPSTYASGAKHLSGCGNSSQDSSGNSWCTLANIQSKTLEHGEHTIDVRVYCDSGGTVAKIHGGILRALVMP